MVTTESRRVWEILTTYQNQIKQSERKDAKWLMAYEIADFYVFKGNAYRTK